MLPHVWATAVEHGRTRSTYFSRSSTGAVDTLTAHHLYYNVWHSPNLESMSSSGKNQKYFTVLYCGTVLYQEREENHDSPPREGQRTATCWSGDVCAASSKVCHVPTLWGVRTKIFPGTLETRRKHNKKTQSKKTASSGERSSTNANAIHKINNIQMTTTCVPARIRSLGPGPPRGRPRRGTGRAALSRELSPPRSVCRGASCSLRHRAFVSAGCTWPCDPSSSRPPATTDA